jgi:predicted naringenin-chalcone synthase
MGRSVIADFRIIRPRHEISQSDSFQWLAEAHSIADPQVKPALMLRALQRFGCSPEIISRRGHELSDFTHRAWGEMEIFRVQGGVLGLSARTRFFKEAVDSVFERFYAEDTEAPGNILHVTCSGYVSPSGAQRLVARKNWHGATRVTHAYHMGCYAAFPALRIAHGFLSAGDSGHRVDVVHTELCSLHLNPLLHSPEQLVVQTLFADGFVRYSVLDLPEGMPTRKQGLEIIALREEIIPESEDLMTWVTSDWGMQMTLSREVPVKIAACLEGFVQRLLAQGGLEFKEALDRGIFAIHPGGPRILELVQKQLGLTDRSLAFSRAILRECGNMSSATLPHIWNLINQSPEVPSGAPIISLAFGPGLTVCGGLLKKT